VSGALTPLRLCLTKEKGLDGASEAPGDGDYQRVLA